MSWGLQTSPYEAHSCDGLLGLHCSSRVGLELLRFNVALFATVSSLPHLCQPNTDPLGDEFCI